MNVKSMIVGFLIAVVASTGTYFLVPPPSGAEASNCATYQDVKDAVTSVWGNREIRCYVGLKSDGFVSCYHAPD